MISVTSQHSLCCWKTVQQGSGSGIITDLSRSHEKAQWSSVLIGDGMQLRIYTAFGTTNQAARISLFYTQASRTAGFVELKPYFLTPEPRVSPHPLHWTETIQASILLSRAMEMAAHWPLWRLITAHPVIASEL